MKQEFASEHWTDANGNPAGGCSSAKGICISWQHGPLGRGAERREPNGAFVETVMMMAQDRLEFYQETKFACDANQVAIEHLRIALTSLSNRTLDREVRSVEGTHEI